MNYGSGDYSVIAELSGCSSSPISASTTVNVISPADLTISSSVSNVCAGYDLTSSDLNSAFGEPTGYTRTWYYQAPSSTSWTSFNPASGISLVNNTTSNVIYSIKAEDVHDGEGCPAPSNVVTITVYPRPIAPSIVFDNTTATQVTICGTSSEAVTAQSTSVGSPTFKWYYSADNSTYSDSAAQVVGLNAQSNTAAVALVQVLILARR